jgi:hypothetical protein
MGQVAGIVHGSRELTGDLDLLWDGDRGQAPALAVAVATGTWAAATVVSAAATGPLIPADDAEPGLAWRA